MRLRRAVTVLALGSALAALAACGTIDNCAKGVDPPPMGWTTPGHDQP